MPGRRADDSSKPAQSYFADIDYADFEVVLPPLYTTQVPVEV